jgi:hypothetical protein
MCARAREEGNGQQELDGDGLNVLVVLRLLPKWAAGYASETFYPCTNPRYMLHLYSQVRDSPTRAAYRFRVFVLTHGLRHNVDTSLLGSRYLAFTRRARDPS